jgi:hypothetical protein
MIAAHFFGGYHFENSYRRRLRVPGLRPSIAMFGALDILPACRLGLSSIATQTPGGWLSLVRRIRCST